MNRLFLIVLFIALLGACTTPKMALDSNKWNNTEALGVAGRNNIFSKETMQFGNFKTTAVKRSWLKGSSSKSAIGTGSTINNTYDNIISIEYINKKQTLKFNLADDAGNSSEVFCVTKFNAEDLQIGNNPNSVLNIATEIFLNTDKSSNTYYAQLFLPNYKKPWELLLDNQLAQAKPKSYTGIVSLDKENYYTLKPVTQLLNKKGEATNMLFGSIGFEIINKNNQPVAAVSTINKGVVYFNNSMNAQEKFLLANICTAILLRQNIE